MWLKQLIRIGKNIGWVWSGSASEWQPILVVSDPLTTTTSFRNCELTERDRSVKVVIIYWRTSNLDRISFLVELAS